jgi:hypothetical protein
MSVYVWCDFNGAYEQDEMTLHISALLSSNTGKPQRRVRIYPARGRPYCV